MKREQEYQRILDRMHRPENCEKYDAINKNPELCREDTLLSIHLSHIRDYLYILAETDDDLVATSCDAALRSVSRLLDERGWK